MSAVQLRAWQQTARDAFHAQDRPSFLTVATPGAGKTTFALSVAMDLFAQQKISRVVVVAPTDHLRRQWAVAAARLGIHLDPELANRVPGVPRGFHGYSTTYASVAASWNVHARRVQATDTLVILDEVHHCADGQTYGDAVSSAFDAAQYRLLLSGTPFRSRPDERIPFVTYDDPDSDGNQECRPDFVYGYRDALADRVVRPVVFAAYSGTSRWLTEDEDEDAAGLGDAMPDKRLAKAWRAALDPNGQWIPHVIAAADARLSEVRAGGMPDAGAMIVAPDQETAKAYAGIVTKITGHPCAVAVSEDPNSSTVIEEFRRGTARWLCSVRLVSEGTDIPRLAVGVLANATRTRLSFEQLVGRFVRARSDHEHATVFLPAVRPLLAHAADMESPRAYAAVAKRPLPDGWEPLTPVERTEPTRTFAALGSEAQFAHVLSSGRAVIAEPTLFDADPSPAVAATLTGPGDPVDPYVGVDDDDADFLGIPGLLDPAAVAATLAARDRAIRAQVTAPAPPPPAHDDEPVLVFEQASALRREINTLVGRVAARSGIPHGLVHSQVRQAVPGPPSREASMEQLTRRRDWLLTRVR